MTRKRLFVLVLSGVLTILLAITVGIFATGQVARNKLAQQFPPPGKMIVSGDHQLHVFCEGSGATTILIQAGLNDFSLHWRELQSRFSKLTKTCVLDRAGLGWSESGKTPTTLQNMVSDMHNVLTVVAPNEPLVLVGHSFGGVVVRAYAQTHPGNIKAMVLVDPANEFMPERINGYGEVLAKASSQFKTLGMLASTGLMALQPENIPALHLSGHTLDQYRAVLSIGEFFYGASRETGMMVNNLHAMQTIGQNETIKWPMVIVSRGQPDPIPGLPEASTKSLEDVWAALQADLVKRTGAQQVIAKNSAHNIQFSEPELIYEGVRSFLSKGR